MATDDELSRLRALVGPSEISYLQIKEDLEAASSATRAAVLDAGRLRGELTEMSVQLARARQDQDVMQRRRQMGLVAYGADLVREFWAEAVRPIVAKAVRRLGLRRGR